MVQRGVNLGGWLIPEAWMTPKLFEGVRVKDIMTLVATEAGHKTYLSHLRHFLKEADFAWLQAHRITMIRLPVPWWTFSDETPELAAACQERIDWVMRMAERYGIQVLLDYHGARGSQNGEAHSGAIGRVGWKAYRDENAAIVCRMAERYGSSPVLWGVELLNEPRVRGNYFALLRFYRQIEKKLRTAIPRHIRLVYHDGFAPMLFVGAVCSRRPVIMDMHLYEVPCRKDDTLASYMDRRDRIYRRKIRWYSLFQPLIIGEWSGVLPASLLKTMSKQERHEAISENNHRQQVAYSHAAAWLFWSYQTSGVMMWNFRAAIDSGRIGIEDK